MKKTMMTMAAIAAGAAIGCPLFGPNCHDCRWLREPIPAHRMAPRPGVPRRPPMPPRPPKPGEIRIVVQTNQVHLAVYAPPPKQGETQAVFRVEQNFDVAETNGWTLAEDEVVGSKCFFRVTRID